jgi:hypothetical protein
MNLNWLKRLGDLWPTNQDKPATKWLVIGLVTLLVVALATNCARAGDGPAYTQLGLGSTIVRGPAPVVDLSFVYPRAAPGDAALEVGATFVGASTLRDEFQRNNFALRAAIVDGLGPIEVGLGVAYLQNVDTYNGSHLNFVLILGYKFKRWPVTIRLDQHFSNGGTQAPNKGRDITLGIWRFGGGD